MHARMEMRIQNRIEIKTEADAYNNTSIKVGYDNGSMVCYDMIIIYCHESMGQRHLDAEEVNQSLKSNITQ
jgi:hypothetical protein